MIDSWIKKFMNLKVVVECIELSKKLILPGFDKLPVYYVAVFFIQGIKEGLLATKASSMAFKFFLALFPSIIFLLTLIPFIPIENFRDLLLDILQDILPSTAYAFMEDSIIDLVSEPDGGLLSFGFIFAVYLATNGIDGMLEAFKESYNISLSRNYFKQKALSVALLFILTILVVIAIAAIIISEYLVSFIFDPGSINSFLVGAGKWIIIAALGFFGISFVYYLGGDRTQRWRFFSAGSTFSTILVLIVSLGFGFYVDNFANYNKIYGSIGTIIVLMLWIYFISFVLLIGFELNASIQQAGSIKKVEQKIESGQKLSA